MNNYEVLKKIIVDQLKPIANEKTLRKYSEEELITKIFKTVRKIVKNTYLPEEKFIDIFESIPEELPLLEDLFKKIEFDYAGEFSRDRKNVWHEILMTDGIKRTIRTVLEKYNLPTTDEAIDEAYETVSQSDDFYSVSLYDEFDIFSYIFVDDLDLRKDSDGIYNIQIIDFRDSKKLLNDLYDNFLDYYDYTKIELMLGL